MKNRIAMFVAPHTGGIFTFYRRLHQASTAVGVPVCSVELEGENVIWEGYAPEMAGSEHQLVRLNGATGQAASERVAVWLLEQECAVLILTPMTPDAVYDALPHLPASIRVLVRLTEISHHSYRRALRRYAAIDGIITLCPRQESDIAAMAPGVPRLMLPNGVDTDAFAPLQGGQPEMLLKLLVLDRLVHSQKRVLLLPDLCRELDQSGIHWQLTIAGDGPDAAVLRQSLTEWITEGSVIWMGKVSLEQVPSVMSRHHVYLKLSHNEGSPNAILEAMASGLLPVVAHIPGVTDFLFKEGVSGLSVPVDDMRAMASVIVRVSQDAVRLREMQKSARRVAVEQFSLALFQQRCQHILEQLPERRRAPPRSWDEWSSTAAKAGIIRQLFKGLLPLRWRVKIREALFALRPYSL